MCAAAAAAAAAAASVDERGERGASVKSGEEVAPGDTAVAVTERKAPVLPVDGAGAPTPAVGVRFKPLLGVVGIPNP